MGGAGWGMQLLGHIFLNRNLAGIKGVTPVELKRLAQTVSSDDRSMPMAVVLFPEGRDLNKRTIAASNAYADKVHPALPHYTQVLHPKTGGFCQIWDALSSRGRVEAPLLLNTTLGFVDYVPGEVPGYSSIFLKGRCPKEVHIAVEVVNVPSEQEAVATLCKKLFAEKEEQLCAFYSSQSDGAPPNLQTLLGCELFHTVQATSLSLRFVFCGVVRILICEVSIAAVWWFLGTWLFGLILSVETCIFITVSAVGGLDMWLPWHATRWPARVSDHQKKL